MTDLPGEDATEEITFVGPAAAEARLAELGTLPGMAERAVAIRDEMANADQAAAAGQEHPERDAG